jgi:hypothetical protein
VPNAHHHRESIFSHKGWNRLIIVVTAAYMIVIACLVAYERSTINVFDQFDHRPAGYIYWGWSASAYLSTSQYHLQPRVSFIAAPSTPTRPFSF